jgi:hypothetical protein
MAEQEGWYAKLKANGRWLWHRLWCWGKVLVVCRVPLVSAVGGGLMLNFSQAKDFFADLGLLWWQWLAFFVLLFGWAWIVHAVARRALQHDDWVIEAHVNGGLTETQRKALREDFRTPAVLLPRLLGMFVLLSVAWAIYNSGDNLLTAADELPQIKEAYGRTSLLVVVALLFAGLYYVVIWKWRDLQSAMAKRSAWMPRPDEPLLAGTAPFPYNLWGDTAGTHVQRGVRTFDVLLAVVAVAITIAFVAGIFAPHVIANWFPRPLIAPLLFGGGVLLFGEIAAYSHRKRTPFLLFAIAAMLVVQFSVGRFHDIRWIDQRSSTESAQISIGTAIDRWKAANPRVNGEYPRPIIVAGAGGASRAGFMTAAVIGAMIDFGNENKATIPVSVRNRIFAISAVSGSSVGAAVVRAALADAAEAGTPDKPPCRESDERAWFGSLAEGAEKTKFRPQDSWRDCLQQLLAGDFLSPVIVGLGYRDSFPIGFLLGFNMDDRAALLEQAFERRYNLIAGKKDMGARVCEVADNIGLCRRMGYHPDPQATGVWLPLLFLNATSGTTGRRVMLSDVPAGSVYQSGNETGTLLPHVFDLLEMRTSSKASCPSWLARLLNSGTTGCPPSDDEKDTDIRLSTAATISARFPVVSPYATVRDRTRNALDRVVDGGYFENGGLATAADLVWALRAAGLDPVVVSVTNDPIVPADPDRLIISPGQRPALPEYTSTQFFGGFSAIVLAMYQTRQGHQEGSLGYLDSSMLGKHRHFKIGVRPLNNFHGTMCRSGQAPPNPAQALAKAASPKRPAVLEEVSMSWWVSQPVQAYLDGQLCVPENSKELVCELRSGGLQKPDDIAAGCR